MTTMTSAPVQDRSVPEQTVDLSATPGIPLTRLVRVELRKMADTRSGKWLLIGIGVITLAVIGIFYVTADPADRTFFNFMAATNGPQGLLLPVLGILLVTSEWTQRTALVSFTLTPVRSRVLLAKVLGGLIAGMAAIALTVVVAVLATLSVEPTTPGRRSASTTSASSCCCRPPASFRAGVRAAVPELLRRDRQLLRAADGAEHPGVLLDRDGRGPAMVRPVELAVAVVPGREPHQ